jgi:iron(III) transport system ATP-binding protein
MPSEPPRQDVFLSLTDIAKQFGRFTALSGVSLDVAPGNLVTFLGPSGCGKTTLLRIIAGLETQDRGRIVQNGRDISRLPAVVNRRAGRAQIQSRVAELLTLVGLPDSGTKYPGQLSGGQQQRIALARALATSPGLLLLDEPLSALDALERVRLRGEIRALQRRLGVTTIMVTHDQEEALSMADTVVVMNHGRIEQVGTPQQIYREPTSAFVADFVGKVNVLSAVAQGAGRFRVCGVTIGSVPGAPDVAPGTRVKLYLRPEDVQVNGALDGQPSRASAQVQKIEFLGAFCLVTVRLDQEHDQPLLVTLSRQSLDRMALNEGAPLSVGFPAECMRLLA